MLKALKIEIFKTKRTIIRPITVLFPLLVMVFTILFFDSTGYVLESTINQWSFLWLNLYLALIIGLIDRHEKNSTEYKIILSSPTNLFAYELGRILHGVLLSLVVSLVLGVFLLLTGLISPVRVGIMPCLTAVGGLFLTTIWEIPLYTWLSRISNLYVTVGLAFIGSMIGIYCVTTFSWGQVLPYSWSDLFPVALIKLHINGTPIKISEVVPNSSWTIFASIGLFIIFSYLASYSFQKQVIKNA
ncbi:hypothetical protein [Lactobacillus sp. ESL0245]|uniref:hypothetical protein n=2 Tax=Lactobacillus TaxID=1578 RepID=UPI000EFAE59D|nr:hypothetical protein [Lactobacillus sp. ESL0245]RMC24149.1 hypothetical protein F5ESL0247_05285 [Lactobacillus sp. ESL0247]RMC28722.1 hypothetical protein F5ESL0246_05285 [Lactobacillus sp. ESL0246]RMC31379.1 hypothetical protein F5ESL0245_05290 [Lactobacillus sp. ESL0245]